MRSDSKVGTSWLSNPLWVHKVAQTLWRRSINSYSVLAIVCPKILEIMPVDVYNASIILKSLHTPIMLKIMPA